MKLSEFSLATLFSWCPIHSVLYNMIILTCRSSLLYSEVVPVGLGNKAIPLRTGHGEWEDRSRGHFLLFLGLMSMWT